jgi:amino acid transporter
MGTMNVYLGGTSKLIASLANERALPAWLGAGADRSIPRHPLVLIGCVGTTVLCLLLVGVSSTAALVRATSACFISVYVLVLASAVRILEGRGRGFAVVTLVLTIALAVFFARYLLVPAAAGIVAFALHRLLQRRSTVTA